MNCPHCGAEAKEGQGFCGYCGKTITGAPAPPPGSAPPPGAKSPPTKLVAVLVIGFLLLAVGAVFGLVILPKITKKAAQAGKSISEKVEKAADEAKIGGLSEEEIRVLISQLGSGATKQQAKEKLIINREAAKPLLVQATSNPRYAIRWGAVETLREAGYTVDYVPPYIADLQSGSAQDDNSRRIRRSAAKWLGPIKDSRAIGPLKWAAKNDEYRGVRSEAKDSLEDYYGIKM